MALRETPLPRALYRPNLLWGAERRLALLLVIVTGGLGFTALNIPTILLCTAIWFVGIAALRMMAKVDADLSSVFLRSVRYNAYYPARSHPARINAGKGRV